MKKRLSSRLTWLLLVAWVAGLSLVSAVLLGKHLVALPRPSLADGPAGAFAALRGQDGAGRWLLVHVLYAGCKCSAGVADHLLGSKRPGGAHEVVLWVGQDPLLEARFRTAGFKLVTVDPDTLRDRYHVEAAPLLVVLDQEDRPRYVGGYSARKQGADVQDLNILASLQAGNTLQENPVFGCAVSRRLQQALNPIDLP